jgi:DNA modification methylase
MMCGDATKEENYEKLAELLGVNKFDMVFTDPPYNVNYS